MIPTSNKCEEDFLRKKFECRKKKKKTRPNIKVVVNHEEQCSIWPAYKENALGSREGRVARKKSAGTSWNMRDLPRRLHRILRHRLLGCSADFESAQELSRSPPFNISHWDPCQDTTDFLSSTVELPDFNHIAPYIFSYDLISNPRLLGS
jgi:uncharacterized protein YbdZ (MbtH family)